MKTCILRTPNPVEPQNPVPPKPAPRVSSPALYIGLDMHNDTIAVKSRAVGLHRGAALRDHRRHA